MYHSNNVEMIFHSLMKYCSLAVNPCLPLRIGKEMVWSSSESKCFPYFSTSLKKQKSIEKKKKQIRSPSLSVFCFVFITELSQLQSIFVLESSFTEIEKGMGKLTKKLLQNNLQHLFKTEMQWNLHLQNAWINDIQ